MNSTSSTLNALLIGVIVVAIMFLGRDVLIPLALAGILSFMLAPPRIILAFAPTASEAAAAPDDGRGVFDFQCSAPIAPSTSFALA